VVADGSPVVGYSEVMAKIRRNAHVRFAGHSHGTHRPDLEHAKIAALNSLSSPDVQRGYPVRS